MGTLTSALTPTATALIAAIRDAVRPGVPAAEVAPAVAEALGRFVTMPDLLTLAQTQSDPHCYKQHILHVEPGGAFSVVALVWLPGQRTPIHDHICWCVVGVLQGVEREQRYGLREDADGARWLTPLEAETLTPGHTCALVPPEENIHQVCNAGEGVAISIHVYGDDLDIYHSSINQCFDELPIRADDHSGTPVAWRRTRTSGS